MNRSFNLTRARAWLIASTLLVASGPPLLAQEPMDMPPPTVGVMTLQAHAIPVVNELPGRIAATRIAEVRARVSGILQERVFEQGALVQKDDVLYRIDPRLFRVRVSSAQASLQRAEAIQANARQQLERQKTLRERNAATGIDYDTAAVNLAQADADVELAQAALEEARINLEYTEVKAPITGVIGSALVTEGALVTADGTSNLALIQQVNPVYADFTQSAQDLMMLRRAVAEGRLESKAPGEARVDLVFDDGTTYPQAGRLLFANANVDPGTGQIMLRAEFPNTNGELLPGMYVRVRIEQAVRQNALTVPQRAVIRNETGQAQIYVLEGDTARLRNLTLGEALGTEWVVDAGLNNGAVIIVDGVQKVQPDLKVVPEQWAQPENARNATIPAAE